MTDKSGLMKRYEFLIDTLIMISPDFESMNDNDLGVYLEELEGDYFSFFDLENTKVLVQEGIMDNDQAIKISNLKNKINDISPSLWKTKLYRNHPKWIAARGLANEILTSLNITRRKV